LLDSLLQETVFSDFYIWCYTLLILWTDKTNYIYINQ